MELFQEFRSGQLGELGGFSLRHDPCAYHWTAAAMRISRANSLGARRNAPKADASKSKVIVVVMASLMVFTDSGCGVKVLDSGPVVSVLTAANLSATYGVQVQVSEGDRRRVVLLPDQQPA